MPLLLAHAELAMAEVYGAKYVSLHVRKTNRAAISLYRDSLGFKVHDVEKGYYADGESAYGAALSLTGLARCKGLTRRRRSLRYAARARAVAIVEDCMDSNQCIEYRTKGTVATGWSGADNV